jgi:hypothetical protein
VRFALFDGEELPRAKASSDDFEADALRGSKAYAAAHAGQIGELVLLDYIAAGACGCARKARPTARCGRGCGRRRAGWGPARLSRAGRDLDHPTTTTPFLRAGVPAIDLIDWS